MRACAPLGSAATLGSSFFSDENLKENFGEASKGIARQMIQDIETAFEQNLATVAWMDAAARAASLDKLHKVFNKVGYADKWRDYGKLEVGNSYLGNALACAVVSVVRQHLGVALNHAYLALGVVVQGCCRAGACYSARARMRDTHGLACGVVDVVLLALTSSVGYRQQTVTAFG